MYTEPDWSSLTLLELLEKALEFGNKAYQLLADVNRDTSKLAQEFPKIVK